MDEILEPTMDPEDIVEVTPTEIPVSDYYISDIAEFESSEIILDQYQYRVLNGQKISNSLLFVGCLELLVVILLLCRRRK